MSKPEERQDKVVKVLLINGSPHQKGCTCTALSEVAETLHQEGIETDMYWIANKPIGGCIGCFQCAKKQKCVFEDKVNEFTALAFPASADADRHFPLLEYGAW